MNEKEQNDAIIKEKVQPLFDWHSENPPYRDFFVAPVMQNGVPTFRIVLVRTKMPHSRIFEFQVERFVTIESAMAYQGTLLEFHILDAIREMEKTETVH